MSPLYTTALNHWLKIFDIRYLLIYILLLAKLKAVLMTGKVGQNIIT